MLAIFALSCLLAAGCAQAKEPLTTPSEPVAKQADISGYVTDENANALISQIVLSNEAYRVRVNTDLLGRFSAELPLGDYTMEITKGSEYERKTESISLLDRKTKDLGGFVLQRLYDSDCIAGDLHQHSAYSFDGSNSPAEIFHSMENIFGDFP